MNLRNEEGKTGRRLLIFVVVAALLVWWLFSWMPTWFRAMTFKDHVRNLASYAGGYPFNQDNVMIDSLAKAAMDAGVPELNKGYFADNIQRGAGGFRVKVHYERNVKMVGTGMTVPFKGNMVFDWDISQHTTGP